MHYNEVTKDYTADDQSHNWGGFHWMALAYLTRGRGEWTVPDIVPGNTVEVMSGGPVLVSADPNNEYPFAAIQNKESLANHLSPANQPLLFQARSIQLLEQPGSGRSDAEQIIAIKNAVMNTGAVITAMNADHFDNDDTSPNPDPSAWTTIVYKGPEEANHSVAIIGWDDNFHVPGADSPGAWLVQNSWGTSWTPNGTGLFYAAYEDLYIGKTAVFAYEMEERGRYGEVVLQNELGPFNTRDSNPMAWAWARWTRGAPVC